MSRQISYLGFCALGGLTDPRLFTRAVYTGKWFSHMTYWMRDASNV